MANELIVFEQPTARNIHMVVGWRQWADAGSVSSGLPEYLISRMKARKIAEIRTDGFYLFQIPGTHDLVRPTVRFKNGYPEELETRDTSIYWSGNEENGLVILLGDEPHLDIDRYVSAVLEAARTFKVNRMIGLGGVYGELPYDKERMVSANYSLPRLKEDVTRLSVTLSDYQGGASIGSVVCRMAGLAGLEYIGLYAFVPAYNLPGSEDGGNSIRLENDFTAWLGIMRRINYLLKLDFDLAELVQRSEQLTNVVQANVDQIDQTAPELGIRDYLAKISENFSEMQFTPLDDVWEDELRRLMTKFDEPIQGDEPPEEP